MTTLVCDIEANGLTNVTKVHCIVTMDYHTEDMVAYTSAPPTSDYQAICDKHKVALLGLSRFTQDYVDTVDTWIGHNFVRYDKRVLNDVLGIKIGTLKIKDTLIQSRLQKFTGRKKHSLAAWADIIDPQGRTFKKLPDPDSWEHLTPYMLERCIEDTRLNFRVAQYLKSEGVKLGSAYSLQLETATAVILEEIQSNGFALNVPKADQLRTTLLNRANELEIELSKVAPPVWRLQKTIGDKGVVTPKYNDDGIMSKVGLSRYKDDYSVVAGQFSAVKWTPLKLTSTKQKVEWLNRGHWEPTVRTKGYRNLVDLKSKGFIDTEEFDIRASTMWALDDVNFATIKADAPKALKDLGEHAMLLSRVNEIDGWFDALGSDNRVHGYIQSPGAITHRAAHREPNMANVPGLASPYGGECRECFTVEQGNVLVGTDASGIQMRVLAHHLGDMDYINTVTEGDVHLRHLGYVQDILGYEVKDLSDRGGPTPRDRVKTFIYAYVLGCGVEKTALIFGVPTAHGGKIKKEFPKRVPGLQDFIDKLTSDTDRDGYYKSLDGRCAEVKGAHYALSVVLQCDECTLMKVAMIQWRNQLMRSAVPFTLADWVHDEWQTETQPEYTSVVGETQVKSIVDAGLHFNLKVPLNGEYKVGTTWKGTH